MLLYNDLGFKFKKESWQTALIGKTRRITETEAIFMSAHVGENFRYKNTDLIDTCNLHALTIDVSLKYFVFLLHRVSKWPKSDISACVVIYMVISKCVGTII